MSTRKRSAPNALFSIVRKVARAKYGFASNIPVIIAHDSNQEPIVIGEQSYYTTKGGTRINYPSAYRKHGRNNMVYVPSSRRIAAGDQWCKANYPNEWEQWVTGIVLDKITR